MRRRSRFERTLCGLVVFAYVAWMVGFVPAESAFASQSESFTLESPAIFEPPGDFGHALVLDGERLLVTAPEENDGIGRAYVYRNDGSGWALEGTLEPSDAPEGARFGRAAAMRGDFALIGAPNRDGAEIEEGAVYLFRFDGTSWTEVRILTPSVPGRQDFFGRAIGIGNGFVAIGSTNSGGDGRVYVFTPGNPLVETFVEGGGIGTTLSVSGPRFATLNGSLTTAFIYVRSGDSWVLEETFDETGGEDFFDIALDGSTFVTTHRNVVVFERDESGWSEAFRFDEPVEDDIFLGFSVAIAGDRIVSRCSRVDDLFGNRAGDFGVSFVREAFGAADPAWRLDADFASPELDGSRGALATNGAVTAILGEGEIVVGFDMQFCRPGTVTSDEGRPLDVLFVNGQSGKLRNLSRIVYVPEGDDVFAGIVVPPAGGNGKFVVHANPGDTDVLAPLPSGIGSSCFPLLAGDGANPVAVWNGLGRQVVLGSSQEFGMPIPPPISAPTVFWLLFGGDAVNLPAGTVLTLQGLVVDPASPANKPLSITNAVTLEIVP